MNIEQFKKNIESEREASATKYGTKTEYSYKNTKLVSTQEIIDDDMLLSFKAGHEAATNRLLPLLEKAIEVAEFYADRKITIEYEQKDGAFKTESMTNAFTLKARDFLAEIKEEFGK